MGRVCLSVKRGPSSLLGFPFAGLLPWPRREDTNRQPLDHKRAAPSLPGDHETIGREARHTWRKGPPWPSTSPPRGRMPT